MSGVIILNCDVCGAELEADEQQCFNCRKIESKVQVLTLEEKQHFSGITLVQDQQEETGYYGYQASNGNQQMYSRQFTIGGTSLLTKLLLGVIFAGVVFIALPVALFVMSIVGIIFYLMRK